jgi:hypothetical protein
MRAVNRSSWPVWLGALVALAGLLAWNRSPRLSLIDPAFTAGYALFALMVFLALYRGRKRLSMLPLGKASVWLTLHIAGGALALPLFWVHSGSFWPIGNLDRTLAALFYAVCISGIVGYALQLWLPGRLAHAGREVIYERIPAEIALIRAQVEKEILEAADASGSATLGQDYMQSLYWYFERPRFFWNHVLGGQRAESWFQRHIDTVGRYLSEVERPHLARIAELGDDKRHVDIQYAMQALLKRWTLFHVPLAAAMLTLAVWHLIIVHVFAR